MTVLNILNKIGIFNSLSREELMKLANISIIKHYNAGDTLFIQGDTSKHILILIDGIVSIYKHNNKGEEVVIGYFHRYSLLAEAATLKHTPLPSTAKFHSNGAVLCIPLEEFEELLLIYPHFSQCIIMSLLDKVELLQQNIHFNLASSSKEKVLNFYSKNSKLLADLKRYEIASILGITPETLSRITNQLIKEKKLVQTNSNYKVLT